MNECTDALNKLLDEAQLYLDLIKPANGEVKICLELTDCEEAATLTLSHKPEVAEGCEADIDGKVTMTKNTLRKILEGEADAFALTARANMSEKRPIEFQVLNNKRMQEIWEVGKALLTYFFVPGKVKVRNLKPELAGEAHGAHPIPLAYWDGMRSSWILLEKGEVLNREGEKDPWPQLFIVIEGRGKAIIGDKEFEVGPNIVVYIPRNAIHQLIPEQEMKIIWLAWLAQ